MALFTLELILRTVSKQHFAEMFLSSFWWVDVISVVPDYLAVIIASFAGQPTNQVHGVNPIYALHNLKFLKC